MSVESLLTQILSRLTIIEAKIGTSSIISIDNNSDENSVPLSIKAFDEYCTNFLDPFEKASIALGSDAQLAGANIVAAWKELRNFLLLASSCKEPNQATLTPLLSPISSKLKEASTLVKRNEWEKHTKTLSEGIGCLNWSLKHNFCNTIILKDSRKTCTKRLY